ncbi:ABC transporter ATP-binding protein [Clostridium paraputrificum]|uniref:ABC transporter ATP-binding protein n=1 Tax=Clostridium TaxID=1485 RepID=UPI003D338E16
MSNRIPLNFIWSYLSKSKVKLTFICISLFLSVGFKLIATFLFGKSFDNFIDTRDLDNLIKILLVIATFFLLSSAFGWYQYYNMNDIGAKATSKIKSDLFYKVESLSLDFFEKTNSKDLLINFTKDISNIEKLLSNGILKFIYNSIQLIGILILMFILDVRLSLITLGLTLIIYIIVKSTSKRVSAIDKCRKDKYERLNDFIENDLLNLKIIKAYGLEKEKILTFHQLNKGLKDISIKSTYLLEISTPLLKGIYNISLVILAVSGGISVIKGTSSIGIFIEFIILSRLFFQSMKQLYLFNKDYNESLESTKEIIKLINEKISINDNENSKDIKAINGSIDFNNVSFKGSKNIDPIKAIHLSVQKGEKVVLVGSTDSGKSTILNLINRFYDTTTGEIKIDGNNIRNIKLSSLRSKVVMVPKETTLFTGTIKDNILYGKLDSTDEEVESACRQAGIHDYISTLTEGYDTEIISTTSLFTEEQEKLISIARTILSKPDIVLMEEGYPSTNIVTQIKIHEAIKNLTAGKTSFIIAHNIKTLKSADKILVMKNGEIVEEGKHEELINHQGLYEKIFNNQFSNTKNIC